MKLQISKLDAARRQLETAIRLYFSQCDPVSIHTLISAAYNVLRDINKKLGGDKLLMKDGLIERVKEGHEKEAWQLINKAENFFKHADKDHEEILEFNPNLSEYLMWEACAIYVELTSESPPLFKLYHSWFIAHHQNLFILKEDEKIALALGSEEILQTGKEQFLNMVLPILTKINT